MTDHCLQSVTPVQRKLGSILLWLTIFLAAGPVSAGNVGTLLNSRGRPTIADVEREVPRSQYPTNPFSGGNSTVVSNFENEAPRLIAEFEFAHPHGVFMPLGRDAVLLGDIFDAFYRAYGENDRVLRLNASGNSIKGADDQMLVRFIESSGVDLHRLLESDGYAIVDWTNYSSGGRSQSTKIMSAVYGEYERRGGNRADLVDKFATFNLNSRTGVQVLPGLDRQHYINEQREIIKGGQPIPARPMAVSVQPTNGTTIYTIEWHDTFKFFEEQEDGRVVAAPGPDFSGHHSQILHDTWEIMDRVRQPEFLERVRQEAAKLGYEFHVGKPRVLSCENLLR